MKKVSIFLLACLIIGLAACSSDDKTDDKTGETDVDQTEEVAEEQDVPEAERIFVQEFSEDDRLDFTGLMSSDDGGTIIFTLKEEIKRESNRERHIIYGENEAINLKELSDASEEDLEGRLCSNTSISPNGKYVTFKCVSDEEWFLIYDTETEEVIEQVEEPEEFSTDLIGLTDELAILRYDESTYTVSVQQLGSDEVNEFDLVELSGENDLYVTGVIPTADGKRFLVHGHEQIYLLDTEAGSLDKIVDVAINHEEVNSTFDELLIGTVRMSSNGKYVYYRMAGVNKDDAEYSSGHFIDLETMTTQSYTDFDYSVPSIDNDGHALLYDRDEFIIYSIQNEEAKQLPIDTTGTYVERPTLVADGNTFFYADRPRSSDETPAYELFKIDTTNKDQFETVTLNATVEDTAALGDASTEAPAGDGFQLHPFDTDVVAHMTAIWDDSETIPFPTAYPETVEYTTTSMLELTYRQNTRMDSGQSDRRNISFLAKQYPDFDRNDVCIDDDLELEETIDGIDYFFYAFSNGEVELGFVDENDWCYSIEGKGFTKEEMFAIADSMETQGKLPTEIPIDEVLFPSEMPAADAEISRTHSVEKHDGTHDFFVTYRGDDGDVTIDFEASQEMPDRFDDEDAVPVELENGLEGSFYADTERLFAYDGTYYYSFISKIDEDVLEEAGGTEQLQDVLTQLANSLQ